MSSPKMRRRSFLGSSFGAGLGAAGIARAQPAPPAGPAPAERRPKPGPARGAPELYELRTYHLRIGAMPKLVNDFLGEVLVPALGRLGRRPVGAFTTIFGPQLPSVTLLVPYDSLATYAQVQERLPGELAKSGSPAARAYLDAPAAAPAFVRYDSQLLQAFPSFPRLEVPAAAAEKGPRIFELRTYESPSEAASAKKMEMFTPRMGELEIFRRVGLTPVFFARTLVGPRQPSFVYMLTFPDLAAREKAWAAFRSDPEWLKLRATPGYADTDIMSNIVDLVLAPTPYSQI